MAQSVVWVTTDVKVPLFIDTLRIDVVGADGETTTTREQSLPEPRSWPVSFGVVADGKTHRLRLRVFRADRVRTAAGRQDPIPAYTIDRFVDITPPFKGTEHVSVLLSGDCMGVEASPESSCVSDGTGSSLTGRPSERIASGPPAPELRPGSWIGHKEVGCEREPRADSGLFDDEVCIPGGAFFMGDERIESELGPTRPAHLVRMSPFFIDRYEVTVGRITAARARGFVAPLGYPPDQACSLGGNDPDRAASCIIWDAARAFCKFDGGDLPSEAQWEYVAVGRDENRMYPFGDAPPSCDDALFGVAYDFMGNLLGVCAKPDYRPPLPDVPGRHRDESRDGVRDLAGNLREWTADGYAPYGSSCWPSGAPLLDPACPAADIVTRRGGTYWDRASVLKSALRWPTPRNFLQPGSGFRCVRTPR